MRLIPEKGERRGDSLISPHIGVARRAGRPLITCERGSAGSTRFRRFNGGGAAHKNMEAPRSFETSGFLVSQT